MISPENLRAASFSPCHGIDSSYTNVNYINNKFIQKKGMKIFDF